MTPSKMRGTRWSTSSDTAVTHCMIGRRLRVSAASWSIASRSSDEANSTHRHVAVKVLSADSCGCGKDTSELETLGQTEKGIFLSFMTSTIRLEPKECSSADALLQSEWMNPSPQTPVRVESEKLNSGRVVKPSLYSSS